MKNASLLPASIVSSRFASTPLFIASLAFPSSCASPAATRLIHQDPTLEQRPLLKADLFRYFAANLSFLDA